MKLFENKEKIAILLVVEIFQISIHNEMEGTFPSILKLGKITPVYKKDDEQLLENYRPISTLPIFGEIFENIIYTRLYGFFTSNNILNKSQFGFRKSHSTSHALNYSINCIEKSIKLLRKGIMFLEFLLT